MKGNENKQPVGQVFLADDDTDDQMLFEDALREIDDSIDLATAKDGLELLAKLHAAATLPDILFLDLNMPLRNGFECLEEIRTTPRFQTIPVVVCSTSSDKRSLDLVYNLGANYYLQKPNSFAQLKEAIAHILALDFQDNVFRPSRAAFVLNY